MALTIQQVYALCQPLTDSYIVFSNKEFEIFKDAKHQSCYDPVCDMICITISQIRQQANYHNIPISRMFLYILLHEIGHSLDPNVQTEEDVLTLEKTAWNIADTLMNNLKIPKTKEYLKVKEWQLNNVRKE